MDKVFSKENKTLKNTGKLEKSTWKVREKSGNFVSLEKWDSDSTPYGYIMFIAQPQTQNPTPYFYIGQESQSVPESSPAM